MVYQAPKHTKPDFQKLQILLAQANWKRTCVQRDADSFKDCCASPSVAVGDGHVSQQSELLSKDYKFRNFREAFAWMTAVAAKAEELQHHPEWTNVCLCAPDCTQIFHTIH